MRRNRLILGSRCAVGAVFLVLPGLLVWAAGPPPKETPPTGRSKSCVEDGCHAKERSFQFVHGPAAIAACDVCHSYTDEKAHKFALKAEKDALCNFCHVGKTEGRVVHQAVKEGQCLGCHNPHGASNRWLLRADDMGKLCAGCHGDVTRGRSHVHGPVAAGNCAACHNSHSSEFPKLLVGQGRALCLGCHDQMSRQIQQVKFIHKPVEGDCSQCHEAHASSQIMQLKQTPLDLCSSCHQDVRKVATTAPDRHTPVTADKACLNCHTAHGGDIAKLINGPTIQVCLACHAKPTKQPDGRTVPAVAEIANPTQTKHGPIRDGNCSGCHNVHGGGLSRLLTQPYPATFYQPFELDQYALCFSCHSRQLALLPRTAGLTGFRNGDVNLHYLHVNKPDRGRSCRACHSTHAGPNPMHIRKSVPYGQWDMPIQFTQTSTGGSCTPGCHQKFAYDRERPAPSQTTTRPATDAPGTPASLAEEAKEMTP